mmetsp:Transcript_5662/g.9379  ORF Transcript_5662/g.9379 Transcript_5662/m.9379 type:complete len:598 (-) Transcript_5662:15-1808(-)
MELDKLRLDMSVLSFRLSNDVTLKVDESSKVLLEHNFFRLGRDVHQGSLHVRVEDRAKPVAKLGSVSDRSTQSQNRAVAGLDNSLQGIAFWSIQCMHLIEHQVIKLAKASIENHKLLLSLSHFLTGTTAHLADTPFEGARSSNVNLGFSRNLLEGNLIGTNGNISLEELVVGRRDLPDKHLTGKHKENGSIGTLTGVSAQQCLSRRGWGAHNGRSSVINRIENGTLPVLQLELSVVTTERWQTIRHLRQLKGNQVFLSVHELASILERILVSSARVAALPVESLERLSFGGQHNLRLLFDFWGLDFWGLIFLLVLFGILLLVLLARLLLFLLGSLFGSDKDIGGLKGRHFFESPKNVKHFWLTCIDGSLFEVAHTKVKHLDHAVNLASGRFATGFLKGLERLEVGQLLEIALVILDILFGSVGLLNLFCSRLLLLRVLLSSLFGSLFGSGGSRLLCVLFELGLGTGFLLFFPLESRVKDGAYWWGHVTENEWDGGLLFGDNDGLSRFLIKGLSNTIFVHESSFVDPENIERTNLEKELRIGDWGLRSCGGSGGGRCYGCRRCIVGCAGGISLLRGRNERHKLDRDYFCCLLEKKCLL